MNAPESSGAPRSDIGRLVRRVTMGVTSAEMARAASLGYREYLEYQLDYTRIDDRAAETFVAANYPALALSAAETHTIPQPVLIATLQEATLYRAAFSNRQLYERMVELWSDHFNIGIDKVGVNKLEDDRDVIRRHALGNFGDLLKASSRSVAMLGYLDQFDSRAGHPNQNYARELMELHTLGVTGGYTEQDVNELSRVLTGWTFERRFGGSFLFDPARHDWDAKRVMDVRIPAVSPSAGVAGAEEGEQVIDRLLNHPSTARFIAGKLINWLLTAAPTETQIAAVADVYTKTKGDIKSMVRATLKREWLMRAPLKFKQPVHFVASALRALAPTVKEMSTANGYLADTGQELFKWETPDGYPDRIEYWDGNLLSRWEVANRIVNMRSATQFDVDVSPYLKGKRENAIDRINREIFGNEAPPRIRTALLAYARGGSWDETRARETLALALSTPAFQWY